jgi:acyl-CoA thioesterase
VYPFWRNLEGRPVDPELWRDGRPRREPAVQEWYRFRPVARFDDPFLDAGRALLLIDTMIWPASCQWHVAPEFLAPSLDVTAWFHRPSREAEWLLCDATAPIAEGGLIGGTARIWDEQRRLVASGGPSSSASRPPEPQTRIDFHTPERKRQTLSTERAL